MVRSPAASNKRRGSAALLSAQHSQKPAGWLGVRIMVWVGTPLPTRGVVFQWATTMKTGRRSS